MQKANIFKLFFSCLGKLARRKSAKSFLSKMEYSSVHICYVSKTSNHVSNGWGLVIFNPAVGRWSRGERGKKYLDTCFRGVENFFNFF